MTSPPENSSANVFVFISVMVLVAIIGGGLTTVVDLYFASPSDKGFRFVLFSFLIGSSIFFHCWILEFYRKLRILGEIERDIQEIRALLKDDNLIPMESRKPFAEQLIALFEAKRQCQGYYQILPTQREAINIFGDYYKNMTDNKQQFTARDINVHNSPGTNFGIENVSSNVANSIQQLPDSNNKSVL